MARQQGRQSGGYAGQANAAFGRRNHVPSGVLGRTAVGQDRGRVEQAMIRVVHPIVAFKMGCRLDGGRVAQMGRGLGRRWKDPGSGQDKTHDEPDTRNREGPQHVSIYRGRGPDTRIGSRSAGPRAAPSQRVSAAGGSGPRWSWDGRWLLYITPDGQIMRVAVQSGDRLDIGRPERKLLIPERDLHYLSAGESEIRTTPFVVTPDPDRFLILMGGG